MVSLNEVWAASCVCHISVTAVLTWFWTLLTYNVHDTYYPPQTCTSPEPAKSMKTNCPRSKPVGWNKKEWALFAVKVPLQYSYGDQVMGRGSLRAADQKNRARLGWMNALECQCKSVCVCVECEQNLVTLISWKSSNAPTYSHEKRVDKDSWDAQLYTMSH